MLDAALAVVDKEPTLICWPVIFAVAPAVVENEAKFAELPTMFDIAPAVTDIDPDILCVPVNEDVAPDDAEKEPMFLWLPMKFATDPAVVANEPTLDPSSASQNSLTIVQIGRAHV